jgi:hypothetical protein
VRAPAAPDRGHKICIYLRRTNWGLRGVDDDIRVEDHGRRLVAGLFAAWERTILADLTLPGDRVGDDVLQSAKRTEGGEGLFSFTEHVGGRADRSGFIGRLHGGLDADAAVAQLLRQREMESALGVRLEGG